MYKENVFFFRAEEEESKIEFCSDANIEFCSDANLGFDFMQIPYIGTAATRKLRKREITTLKQLVDEMDTIKFLNKKQRKYILKFWKRLGFLFFEF